MPVWNAVLPDYAPARALEENITADWLVIGAGFAGLAAARRLAQLRGGERIVVLEAGRVGTGPAGRNSGFMIDLPHDLQSESYTGAATRDRRETAQNRQAIAMVRDVCEEFALPEDCLRPIGKMNAAATTAGDRHNRDYQAHLHAMGEGSELLDARQMREITGSDYYLSGLFTPGCALLQPAMYVRGLADGLASRSLVDIYENSPVLSYKRSGPDWRVQTPSGSVTAPKVILAVNGHATSFGFFERQLMPVFTYASVTRALTADEVQTLGGSPEWGATPADPLGTSVRRITGTGGDRLLVRNRFTYDPSLEVSERRIRSVARSHDRAFRRRWPLLAGVEMEYRWGGRLCLSRNSVPVFGEAEDGMITAVCHNGLGTTKGTLAGFCAAELAAGGTSPLVAELQAAPEPSRLPPEPVASLGANATLRWKEWRAGREL